MDNDREEALAWIAAETQTSRAQVAAELEAGERRRTFVVDELIEAGFEGSELVELCVRLTGLPRMALKGLIAARAVSSEANEVPQRDLRLVANEIRFRSVNEQLAALDQIGRSAGVLNLVCECADRSCWKPMMVEASEYDWLRQDPQLFVVLPGHEAPAVEAVAERRVGFVVIRKHPETHTEAELTDPRRPQA